MSAIEVGQQYSDGRQRYEVTAVGADGKAKCRWRYEHGDNAWRSSDFEWTGECFKREMMSLVSQPAPVGDPRIPVGSEWDDNDVPRSRYRVVGVDGGRVSYDYVDWSRAEKPWKRSGLRILIDEWLSSCTKRIDAPAEQMNAAMDLARGVSATSDPDRCWPCGKRLADCTCVKVPEKKQEPAKKAHDFSDRYCVSVAYLGGTRTVRPACKDCGTVKRWPMEPTECEPDPNWRRSADDNVQWAMPAVSPRRRPTYAAPELRAANTWACGLIRGTR